MKVAHLTIVFADDIDAKAAKYLTDEIADEAISYEAVDAVRCDVAEFDKAMEIEFWDEAAEQSRISPSDKR